jgi:hypothetical protein
MPYLHTGRILKFDDSLLEYLLHEMAHLYGIEDNEAGFERAEVRYRIL